MRRTTMDCLTVRELEKPSANVRIKQLCGYNNYCSHFLTFVSFFLWFGKIEQVRFETSEATFCFGN